jgi:1-acyl-sn-glycerol-3-phosphate acyltransferase
VHARTGRLVRSLRWTRTLAHVGAAFLILRLHYPRASRARRRAVLRWWSEKLLRILAVEVRHDGLLHPADDSAMVVANHVSWIDMFSISAARPTRFIAKSEIRDWPVAGMIAERAGTLFVHRARRHDTGRIANHVKDALAAGDCVGLFPEGTTTEGDQLLKFHSSLFEPAVAHGALVHPVGIRYLLADGTPCRAAAFVGELTFVQSLGLVIRTPEMVVRLSFAEPVDPAGRTRRELAAETQTRVATLLGLAPPDNAPGRGGDPPAGSP